MISITKKFSFCYGHHLPGYIGKCVNFHGHNSEIEVEFQIPEQGSYTPYKGMIVDFSDVKKYITPLIDILDHKNLNDILSEEYFPPTVENMVKWIVHLIQTQTPFGSGLIRCKISETPTSWAEWRK